MQTDQLLMATMLFDRSKGLLELYSEAEHIKGFSCRSSSQGILVYHGLGAGQGSRDRNRKWAHGLES